MLVHQSLGQRVGETNGLTIFFPVLSARVTRLDDTATAAALANATGFQLAVLGSGVAPPTPSRGAPCIAVRGEATAWLFDAGDDTQRQLVRTAPLRSGRVDAFFVTSRAGGGALGLPGMLCIASAARDATRETMPSRGGGGGYGRRPPLPPPIAPVAVFGPPGVADFLAATLALSDTFLAMPVTVFEFVWRPHDGPPPASPLGRGARAERTLLSRRARLSVAQLTPDAFNPHGFHDVTAAGDAAAAAASGGRATRPSADDPRASTRPPVLPGPSHPGADLNPHDACWTLLFDRGVVVTAVPLGGGGGGDDAEGPPALAFTVREPARAGRLDVDAAHAAGVPPGRAFSDLKQGRPVSVGGGRVVQPGDVVGADVPGRVIALAGDPPTDPASPSSLPNALTKAALSFAGADLLVAGAASAADAGAAAAAAGVGTLLLTRFPPGADPGAAVAAASAAAGPGVHVMSASDMDVLSVERREAGKAGGGVTAK